MKYRSNLEIISTILRIALTTEATRSRVMYRSRLSYTQTTDYLEFLMSKELILFDEETKAYRVTYNGLRLLNKCDELLALTTSHDTQIIVESQAA